jgi:hypothetical protein
MSLLTLGQELLDASKFQYDCDECCDGDCYNCIHIINLLDITDELESKIGCNVH